MSIAIFFDQWSPKRWTEALRKALPDTTIEIYPDITAPEEVTFALCWKPAEKVLVGFPNLKVVQSAGAGVDHITRTQTLSESMVLSRIVDEQLSEDMWEFLLAAVMTQLKNLPKYVDYQRQQTWKRQPYRGIQNTNIGILGLGVLGAYVAERFAELGFPVAGWSNSPKNITGVDSHHGEAGRQELLSRTDMLINLLPLTSATENILDKNLLGTLKKEAFLINVGRGPHLVEEDLIALLDSGHLSGTLLDVFRQEPLPESHPFWQHPKIQVTPHVASVTNIESAVTQIADNYTRFHDGRPLLHTVNIGKGY